MKKIILSLSLITLVIIAGARPGEGEGKKKKSVEVPQAVNEQFKQLYPAAAKVKWKEKNGAYLADFMNGKAEVEARFSAEGTRMEATTEVKLADVPPAISAAAIAKYPDLKAEEGATKVENAEGVFYAIEMEGKKKEVTLTYDANVNLVKETPDDDDEEEEDDEDGEDDDKNDDGDDD